MKVEALKAAAAAPEMIVAFMACLILVAALYMKKETGHKFTYGVSVVTLVFVAIKIMMNFSETGTT
ncbi:MAG: hypothetical protein WBM41_20100, partial [Arenicellales bacterium]